MRDRVILSLFDHSGAWSKPYADAGYHVVHVCLPERDVRAFFLPYGQTVHGILAAPPCTEFAVSGARWWKGKPASALAESLELIDVTLRIIELAKPKWYAIENPIGRLRRLRPQLGAPTLTFDPCDYGDPWTKRTQVFGSFVPPPKNRVEPTMGSRMHLLPPGPDRQHVRSRTPDGFARAFFESNP